MKCEHCGKEGLKHQGALNLHRKNCEPYLKQKYGSPAPEEDKTEKTISCKHEWRLLRNNVIGESMAIQDGYKEVCGQCHNLR